MRIIVLGAGVIGTATAYYLAKAGHKVEVFERQDGVADETSFANAGQLSFGYSSPWAAPGMPLKGIKWLFQQHAPFAMKLTFHPDQYFWMLRLLANCRHKPYLVNKERMLRVAEYSRHCIDQLRAETGIQYEGRQLGTTQILRTPKQLKSIEDDIRVLDQMGVPYQRLDRNGLNEVEPALAQSQVELAGGLNFPQDQTGDCHLFTQYLAKLAKKAGVKFNFGQDIERLVVKDDEIKGVHINKVLHLADHYVVAMGSFSTRLLKSCDLRIPVYPFKGYSLTAKVVDETRAPRSTVLDESYKIAITRFDQRIRVGGMAEIVGHDLSLKARRKETLAMVAQELYPDAGQYQEADFWCGLRPATPDSTPIIGKTPYANLWTNTGHGTLGWTMACGSGRYLADLISGNAPEISSEGLDMSRYSKL